MFVDIHLQREKATIQAEVSKAEAVARQLEQRLATTRKGMDIARRKAAEVAEQRDQALHRATVHRKELEHARQDHERLQHQLQVLQVGTALSLPFCWQTHACAVEASPTSSIVVANPLSCVRRPKPQTCRVV